ncbi:Na+/H+ antiporter [Bacillus spizizenii]|nr:Na+/H+ antiporter [Bacillus spizizenii]
MLSLPRDFPGREDILVFAFSVVLFSLVVQGLTIKPLLERLGVNQKEEGNQEYEELLAKGHRLETAIKEVQQVKHNLLIHEAVSSELTDQYKKEVSQLHQQTNKLFETYPELKNKQQTILKKHSLYAQYQAIENLSKEDIISNEVAELEQARIIDEIVRLQNDH